ncbi:MAG: 2,3-bisphosphoglycerate-independent phosphoglycerate mutase, partial [Elusimicrobia bacterium]|nr:2,3-bisphosphoglycerate-independent phosphoglycerate mutase [Elusimicrobiota bacterium]
MNKPVVLVVRDGWGVAPDGEFNAVSNAKKPNVDGYLKKYPHTLLEACGVSVGLPQGYQGSSEVGHLNMGAGRIVVQELKRIMDLISDGSLFLAEPFKNAIDNCLEKNSTLHLMGLVQDEGVHAHEEHLFAIMRHARERDVKKLLIHFFSDGRDTPPQSAIEYVRKLENEIKEIGIGKIATLMGRYYAMDRSENWMLTDLAYDALVNAQGIAVNSAEEAVLRSYRNDKNPDGANITDEYIPPSIINGFNGIKDGDSVIHFNFRQDRAIQLTKAFVEDDYPGKRQKKLNIVYCGLTRYYDSFKFSALAPMDEDKGMKNLLGEVISEHGLRQLRIAETQKFKHVTSFFNGKLIK